MKQEKTSDKPIKPNINNMVYINSIFSKKWRDNKKEMFIISYSFWKPL